MPTGTADDYFATLVLTAIDVAEVSDNGGDVVAIEGEFVYANHTVAIATGAGETPCYMGVSGDGLTSFPDTPTSLTFVVPVLARGGPYSIVVRTGAQEEYLINVLTVRNRSWQQQAMTLRQVLAPALKTGPRTLDVTDPLAADDTIPDPLP